jgi:hypothetical protein
MSKGFLGPGIKQKLPGIGKKNPGNLNPPITSYKAAKTKKITKKQEILGTLFICKKLHQK